MNSLDLSSNQISDINVLEKVKFGKLKELDLSFNSIKDINVFNKTNFKDLNKLNLRHNNIYQKEYSSVIDKLEKDVEEFDIDIIDIFKK